MSENLNAPESQNSGNIPSENSNNNASKNSSLGLVGSIFSNWSNLLRSLIFIFALIIFAICSLEYVKRRELLESAILSTDHPGVILNIKKNNRNVNIIDFHSSLLWKRDDFCIKPTDKIIIKANGTYNTAIHHIVEAAISDSLPFFPWCGPEGIDVKYFTRPADLYRIRSRIDPSCNYGGLLMQFVPKGRCPADRPLKENFRFIGKGETFPSGTFKEAGRIFFAVNEIPLNYNMESTYVITNKIDPDYVKKRPDSVQKKAWKYIKDHEYWNVWYDDNVGSILITVEIISE